MTPEQRTAYNAGVMAALDLARQCSDALAPAAVHRVTRLGFAMGALDAFADEGRALLIEGPVDGAGQTPAAAATVMLPPPVAPAVATSAIAVAPPGLAQRQVEARARGYTGDLCRDCLNLTMVRNGTCLKCETCGSTSGCS